MIPDFGMYTKIEIKMTILPRRLDWQALELSDIIAIVMLLMGLWLIMTLKSSNTLFIFLISNLNRILSSLPLISVSVT